MKVRCSHDELVNISKLKAHPDNRNDHPQDQIERLAKILEYQGWRYPVKVSNQSGFITSGHGRVLAAKHLGWKQVPVNFQDYDNEDQEYSDIVSDNAIASWSELDLSAINADIGDLGPDFDIDLLGIKDFVIEPADKLDPQCDEDEVPDALPEPKVVRGEVYVLGKHRLMCGDSTAITDVERLMDGKKADLCFTSPPYGQQRDYGAAKEKVQEWDTLMKDVFSIVPLNENGQLLVNLGLIHRDGEWVPYWDAWIEFMRSAGWKRFGLYVWDQGAGMPGDWNGRFAPSFEMIFHFCKNTKKPEKTKESKHAGQIKGGKGQRGKDGKVKEYSHVGMAIQSHKIADSVIRVNRQAAQERGVNHPAMFPVQLVDEIFDAWPDGIAFEPFCGSGTTIISSEKKMRPCFAMELDPKYCAIILDRWQKFTGKKAHREDGKSWDEIKAE
jgi:DNA modification methylase